MPGITIPLMDIKRQNDALKTEIQAAIQNVFVQGSFISGPESHRFEEKVGACSSIKHAIGLNSGTDALILSLKAAGIGAGDEVITSPYTFYATVEAILQVGAIPVFVDINERTYNMDHDLIEAAITPRTKALIPVHIFGLVADLMPIRTLADKYQLVIIQDACQAFGATYQNKPIAAWGDMTCLSFYPTKNLGACGDGGMVLTQNDTYADKIQLLKSHGQYKKYHHSEIGYNSRLDDIQAAILSVKLDRLQEWNKKRQEHALAYSQAFKDLPIDLPVVPKDCDHVYHLYIIRTEKAEALQTFLKRNGVGCGIYYPLPLQHQKALQGLYQASSLPIVNRVAGTTLALPVFPELTHTERDTVINHVTQFFHLKGNGGKTDA